MTDILIIHLTIGPVLLMASLLMKLWPPKKINHIYGYRTPRSTKNQLAWDEANTYSGNLLMWAGISTLPVQVLCFIFVGGHSSILIAISYYLVFVLTSVVLTERRLKAKGF